MIKAIVNRSAVSLVWAFLFGSSLLSSFSVMAAFTPPSSALIQDAIYTAKMWQVPPAIMLAVIHQESRFQSKALSNKGAIGLMQVMPKSAAEDVARLMKLKKNQQITRKHLNEPHLNMQVGAAYLHYLSNHYLQNISSFEKRWLCALAAYNGGFTALTKLFSSKKLSEVNEMSIEEVHQALTQQHAFAETRDYVRKTWQHYQSYQKLMTKYEHKTKT